MRFLNVFRAGLRLLILAGFAALSPVTAANAQTIVHVDPPDIFLTAIAGPTGPNATAFQTIDVNGDSQIDMLF